MNEKEKRYIRRHFDPDKHAISMSGLVELVPVKGPEIDPARVDEIGLTGNVGRIVITQKSLYSGTQLIVVPITRKET